MLQVHTTTTATTTTTTTVSYLLVCFQVQRNSVRVWPMLSPHSDPAAHITLLSHTLSFSQFTELSTWRRVM